MRYLKDIADELTDTPIKDSSRIFELARVLGEGVQELRAEDFAPAFQKDFATIIAPKARNLARLSLLGPDSYPGIINAARQISEPVRDMTTPSLAVFVSHSSKDELLAQALVELLRAALNIPQKAIRCTSVNGYRLEAGANTEERLRVEVNSAKVLIGLITPASMESAYVLFELGARWGQKLPLIPLLGAGAPPSYLRGPLSGLNALSCDDAAQIHQLVEELASKLEVKDMASAAAFHNHIEHLVRASAAAQKSSNLARTGMKQELGATQPTEALPPIDEDELRIIKLYCRKREAKLMVEQIADELGLHPLKTDQLLDRLVKRKLLYEGHRMGSPSTFRLATAGRDFLIEHGIIK